VQAAVQQAYSRTAVALHWLVALLVLITFPLGLGMTAMPLSPQKLQFFSYHKWLGVTVFALMLLRLGWRIGHAAPRPPAGTPRWQQRAAQCAHVLLYLLLLAVPLSGWAYSSAAGVQTVYLGIVPLPNAVAPDKALAALLKGVHYALNASLFVVFCVHFCAALKHHFFDRDGVLARMLPFLNK
jgi:cytochrome b561